MARGKKDKTANIAVDLLGHAFGDRTVRVLRKRSKSMDKPKPTPLLIGGAPYTPQQLLTYTAPLPQQGFPNGMIPMNPYAPPTFIMPHPSQQHLQQLGQIVPHYFNVAGKHVSYPPPASNNHTKEVKQTETTHTTVTVTKHVCANCGRLRSRQYHHDHPIMPEEKPTPAFCRKCQRDASSTSSESGGRRKEKTNKEKKKKKNKSKKRHKVRHSQVLILHLLTV